MAEYNKQQTEIQPDDPGSRVPVLVLRDIFQSFRKLWWLMALLAALFSGVGLVYGMRTYEPMYKAEATFTVETYTTQSGYTFFYDNRTAAQMALTFPYLLDSDLLLERVKIDLQKEYINGVPKAEVVANSNLFTLSVTSRDPQSAYDILHALIRNYPEVAEYVIGKTQLNMIEYPEFPSQPYNDKEHLHYAAIGFWCSLALSAVILLFHAMTRNTIRKESDITDKLYTNWVGSVPMVVPKRSDRTREFNLSIHNSKVGAPFKESFRSMGLQVIRLMEDKKVLMVTATGKREGTSTVTRNLALELADQGKRVILLDGDLQSENPEGTGLEEYLLGQKSPETLFREASGEETVCVLRCSRALTEQEASQSAGNLSHILQLARENADYVLIDAPICQNLDAISLIVEDADAILYVIKQDYAKLPQVMNCFEDLNQFEAKILGCVLNSVRTGITGYGYGYGYGYSYSYGKGHYYGRYGGYGYGEEKSSKGKE